MEFDGRQDWRKSSSTESSTSRARPEPDPEPAPHLGAGAAYQGGPARRAVLARPSRPPRKQRKQETEDKRRLAPALASQYGPLEIVRILLDAGEDPNRFNPVGGHLHSTPLHQAAGNGHLAVVKLLIERGAKRDVKDILFGGTRLGWTNYAGRKEVEAYLRTLDRKTSNEEPDGGS
jgi:ankyrin repeat protein